MLKRSFSSLRVNIRSDSADALPHTGAFQAGVDLRAIESLLISQRLAYSSPEDLKWISQASKTIKLVYQMSM